MRAAVGPEMCYGSPEKFSLSKIWCLLFLSVPWFQPANRRCAFPISSSRPSRKSVRLLVGGARTSWIYFVHVLSSVFLLMDKLKNVKTNASKQGAPADAKKRRG